MVHIWLLFLKQDSKTFDSKSNKKFIWKLSEKHSCRLKIYIMWNKNYKLTFWTFDFKADKSAWWKGAMSKMQASHTFSHIGAKTLSKSSFESMIHLYFLLNMCDSAILNDCKPPWIEYNFLFRSHIIKLSTKFSTKVQVLAPKYGDFMKFLAPLCSCMCYKWMAWCRKLSPSTYQRLWFSV